MESNRKERISKQLGFQRRIGSICLALAMALGVPMTSALAEEVVYDPPWLRLGAGVGFLYANFDEDSPVIGADLDDDILPTVSLFIYPGEALVDAFEYAKYGRVSIELGVVDTDISVGGQKVGRLSAIPLNANFEIHPFPDSRFDPFIGGGFNVTFFTDPRGAATDLKFQRQPVGGLLTAGITYWLLDDLFVDARVRKFYLDTSVRPASGGPKIENLNLDPITAGVTIGYRF